MFISISLRNLTFTALCLAFVLAGSVEADAQTQRRRLAIDAGYAVQQVATLSDPDGILDAESYELAEEVLPLTLGLNYRFTRRMSIYGEYTQSPYYFSITGKPNEDRQFSAITVGWMPLSGFFEFGLGYSRFTREDTRTGASERTELFTETLHGANLRLRFDVKLLEGVSIYAGAQAYAMLPGDDVTELDAMGNANVGVQLYLLGKQKNYATRKEKRELRKLRRERDLEELRRMREGEEEEGG
ncbi:hypothetical protein [Lewinella sp. 4G2]|uniref:hypothetical protein n=1 Tax=Lewinella sp. 4G2 TaxID=1803372 RepID=UPI0007B4D0F5|nr:hypothetical protein [Lewinella sp. 4G2]OAV43628.1 hypothetical protein A3850_003565 [Lewinella sp. 4G2]